ncbi:MAG: asparagine synthetase B family protein, partial [Trebonia sp.]
MCGIAGFVGTEPLDPARVERALGLMFHRGPDNAAHRAWRTSDGRHVELLHTRLTIIDMDHRSDQPLRRGHTWLAYNGELYNYVELRRQLEREGETFSTASDTEVLAAALDRDGWRALDHCEGMWAFAAYDERDGSLLLARDRFGEKPLYLLRDQRGLFFGSEPKFIFALMGRTPPVNRRHLERYLVNGYKSLYKTGETFFVGMEELPPGAALTIGSDGLQVRHAFWQPAE